MGANLHSLYYYLHYIGRLCNNIARPVLVCCEAAGRQAVLGAKSKLNVVLSERVSQLHGTSASVHSLARLASNTIREAASVFAPGNPQGEAGLISQDSRREACLISKEVSPLLEQFHLVGIGETVGGGAVANSAQTLPTDRPFPSPGLAGSYPAITPSHRHWG